METLRIAIQSKGRLAEDSLGLIKDCGIQFDTESRVLKERAYNFPLEFLFVRDDDIPGYVHDGIADIGIVGRNEYDEQNLPLKVVKDLGFAKCRLSVAVPVDFEYQGLASLEGKRIATSYPGILGRVLAEHGVHAKFVNVSGSVEVTPAIGIADCICDLVSTGTTLKANGLREAECVYRTSAVLIARQDMGSEEKQAILQRLMLRINAVQKAQGYKYIMFNLPEKELEKVRRIVPGMKRPTVTHLLEAGWVSVQTVVQEDHFWDVVEQLKHLGAEGILVTAIEKMTE